MCQMPACISVRYAQSGGLGGVTTNIEERPVDLERKFVKMIVHTTDKYGRPIPPEVLKVLNMPVPLIPCVRKSKKRANSQCSAKLVPDLSEVPGLETGLLSPEPLSDLSRIRKKFMCEREPCQSHPLCGGAEGKGIPIREAPRESPEPEQRLSWFLNVFNRHSPQLSPPRDSIPPPTLLTEPKPAAPLFASLTATPTLSVETRKGRAEKSFQKLQIFKVSEKVLPLYRPRIPRMNSNFYRVLALETVMTQKGKLNGPSVSMALQPRENPETYEEVLGICPKLKRRRERQWRELTAEDFGDLEDTEYDESDDESELETDYDLSV